ncbi:enoyl-CoA hydratase/isomerase family protein [Roseovarius pacificus]|uniref:enoyl-CoA hydratase/isomerase family protein n=1 Tax=Roseovarius pacificus TaxID=337701 RepID=UPI002A188461|nr:enoyl-CoA hydratase/isomerase family protein [Roseovarius pacificus]
MTNSTIKLSRQGPTIVVELNRPEKRNAITFQMMDEIEGVLGDANKDRDIRSIVFTGGDSFFSSGMDLNAMKDIGSPGAFTDYMDHWRQLNRAMEECSKVTIASIEGYCLTGGLEFALACDMRVAGEGASFAITSSKIGTVPGAGGSQRLPRLIGVSNALELLLTSEMFDTDWAYRTGLINRKVEKGKAMEATMNLAEILASKAPLSIRFMKRAVYGGMQMPLDEACEYEGFIVNTIYNSSDKLEGISAFLEKRPAKFTGE